MTFGKCLLLSHCFLLLANLIGLSFAVWDFANPIEPPEFNLEATDYTPRISLNSMPDGRLLKLVLNIPARNDLKVRLLFSTYFNEQNLMPYRGHPRQESEITFDLSEHLKTREDKLKEGEIQTIQQRQFLWVQLPDLILERRSIPKLLDEVDRWDEEKNRNH
jgi:hypothetical protein